MCPAARLDQAGIGAVIWGMSHSPSRNKIFEHLRKQRQIEAAKVIADAKVAADVIAIWNARQASGSAVWFYPTIGAALAASLPWLALKCPACHTVGEIDLRKVDRHPGASLESLIPLLKCSHCPGARFPRLVGLKPDDRHGHAPAR